MPQKVKIDISIVAILKVVLVILGLWFLYLIRDVAVLFFIVLTVVAALSPLVEKMEKYFPRWLVMTFLLIAFLAISAGIGFIIIPPLIEQLGQLAINLPSIVNKFGPLYSTIQHSLGNYQEILFNVSNQLTRVTSGLYTTTVGFISGLVAVVTVLVLSFYMLLEEKSLREYLHQTIPLKKKETIFPVVRKIGIKMGNWLRGQFLLMLIIGLLDGVALLILGVPYTLILALWGGLMEGIPYIGPFLGLVPAVLIAFTISPLTALLTFAAYIVIQQLENQFLVPKVMGRAVGLSPVIIILVLLIGAKIMGILGMIIAVPVAAAIFVLIQDWAEVRKAFANDK